MSITFLHGDCLEKMKDLSGASVDCFICDLPYGCLSSKVIQIDKSYRGGKIENKTASACAWDIPINLDAFWEQIRRLRKNDHTPCIMFCTTKFGYDLIKSNEKEFRYDLVWNKTNAVGFLSANKKPMASHEMIYIFSKSGAYYERINIKGDFPAGGGGRSTANFLPIAGMPNTGTTIAGERCPTSVITIPNKKRKGGHPTEKPIELYNFLIQRYCPPGGTILDPTAGSFNSCFAAMELDRHAIGIEKDDGFFDKACKQADNL
jgi:site-specific DNA-methyltransferase (adenine-specific)